MRGKGLRMRSAQIGENNLLFYNHTIITYRSLFLIRVLDMAVKCLIGYLEGEGVQKS